VSVHYGQVDTYATDGGVGMASAAIEALGLVSGSGGKRTRRSYSDEEKRRMVTEACQPGASVADVARRHGVNANLLFNWRRLGRMAGSGDGALNGSAGHCQSAGIAPATGGPAFIPIGMFGRAESEGAGLIAAASPVVGGKAPSARAPSSRAASDERPGVIEIDLADGTRLRVDAFVNERSLRRVLTVLKATS
jgi:transposase